VGYVRNVVMHKPSGSVVAGDVTKLGDNVQSVVSELRLNPFLTGRSIEVDIPAAGLFVVQHGLGRIPMGWFIVDQYSPGGAISYTQIVRSDWDKDTITLSTDGGGSGVTITAWVF